MRLVGVAILIAAPTLALLASAAEPPPTAPLADDPSIEEIRVTGIRTGRFLDAPSAATSTIDPADYQAEGKTLDDLLAEQAGVQIRRFGGAGEPATISIRGSSAQQVDLTLNGLRLNSPLTGAVDVSEMCLGLVDSVSVTRGGPSAIGGRVDLSSPIATGGRVVHASGSAGSFGTFRGEALFSDTLGARPEAPARSGVDLSLGYCGFATDGDYAFQRPQQDNGSQTVRYDPPSVQRVNNDHQKHSGHVGLGVAISPRLRVELHDYVSWQEGGVAGLDSGTGPIAGQDVDARADQLFNLAHLILRAEETGWLGDEAEFGVYGRFQSDDFSDPAVATSVTPDVATQTKMHTAGMRSLQRWERDAFDGRHRIGVGFDADRDAVYASDADDRGRTNVSGELSLASGFLDDRIVIAPGFRAAWSQRFEPAFLPSLGLVLAPIPWLRLAGNVYRSWRVPSFEELYHPDRGFLRGNPALEPERAWGADARLELVFDHIGPASDLTFSAGVFRQDREHEIVWTQVSPWVVMPVNLTSTRHRGIELSLRLDVTRWIGLTANHTELDAELEATGRGVPGRAERESSVRLRVGPAQTWKLIGEWQYVGEIPVSQGGSVLLPARHVGNLTGSLNLAAWRATRLDRVSEAFWIFAAVDNVGDVAVRDALFSPQPGRSVTLGMEVAW